MNRLDKINYYLNIAEEVASRSTCLKRQYGSVIVNNNEIIATGYNGSPRKLKSCLDNNYCLREYAKRGMDYSNCCSVHSEQNAIISASRRDMLNGELYLVGKDLSSKTYVENPAPCSLCKRMIINAGISKVYCRTAKDVYKEYDVSQWNIIDIIGGY